MQITPENLGPLAPHLMDLAGELHRREQTLTLIGGFGLLLRRAYRQEEDALTLLTTLPETRTTDDFDVVLRLEVLADPAARQGVTEVLQQLGYEVKVPYFQFVKPGTAGPNGLEVKVDFLTTAPGEEDTQVKQNAMRVGPAKRPKSEAPLHAYATPELIGLDAPHLEIQVEGKGTDETPQRGTIRLPHPFTLMLMKLHAMSDEHHGKRDLGPRPAFARKHARDLLTLAALLTEAESVQLPALNGQYAEHPAFQRGAEIVAEFFSSAAGPGMTYLRPPLARGSADEAEFLSLLRETYPQT